MVPTGPDNQLLISVDSLIVDANAGNRWGLSGIPDLVLDGQDFTLGSFNNYWQVQEEGTLLTNNGAFSFGPFAAFDNSSWPTIDFTIEGGTTYRITPRSLVSAQGYAYSVGQEEDSEPLPHEQLWLDMIAQCNAVGVGGTFNVTINQLVDSGSVIPTLQAEHYWPLETNTDDTIGSFNLDDTAVTFTPTASGFFQAGISSAFMEGSEKPRILPGSTTGAVIITLYDGLICTFDYSVDYSSSPVGDQAELYLLAAVNGTDWIFTVEESGNTFASVTKTLPVGIDVNNLPSGPVVIIFKRTLTGYELYDSLTDTLTAMTIVDLSKPTGTWFEDVESDGTYRCNIAPWNSSSPDDARGLLLSAEITRRDFNLQDCQDRVTATLASP